MCMCVRVYVYGVYVCMYVKKEGEREVAATTFEDSVATAAACARKHSSAMNGFREHDLCDG